jgi:hypothetical protein
MAAAAAVFSSCSRSMRITVAGEVAQAHLLPAQVQGGASTAS